MGQRKDLHGTGKLVRYEPVLTDWMLAYAEWLASCVNPPSRTERRVQLSQLSRRPVAANHVAQLEERKDFRRYFEDLCKGPLERARAKFQAKFPKYVQAHEDALDMAIEAGDYKAVPAFTIPALDRVSPKKSETGAAVQFNVTLSAERLAGFAEDYTPAEVEAVPMLPPSAEPDATGTP